MDMQPFLGSSVEAECHNLLNNCYGGVSVVWSLGALATGASRTVLLPARINTNPRTGTVSMRFNSRSQSGPGETASFELRVDRSPALAVALASDRGVVPPGGELTYTVLYVNRAESPIDGAVLRAQLPPGVQPFTVDARVADGGVAWDLGPVTAGESGVRYVRTRLPDALNAGELLHASVTAEGSVDGVRRTVGASLITRVNTRPLLRLAVHTSPDPVRPGEMATYALTVTNESTGQLRGVAIRSIVRPLRKPVSIGR